MSAGRAWVTDRNAALLTDLYELTMMQAYFLEEMREEAVFDLFIRRLPQQRNYLLVCGLEDALHYLENLRFSDEAIDDLRGTGRFADEFLHRLRGLRFTGDVHAMPDGTPAFADEPILQVVGPIIEAQVAETFLLNQVHFQTMLASKAARVVAAAAGRAVVDFGLRRMHGTDAGMKAARAFYIAGVSATSNVLAGQVYGIPISGTMAHSYIEAHDDEMEAFRAFAGIYPETVLLVDTYDTIEGVKKVVDLARQLGNRFQVKAVRLDSGDIESLSKETRRLLDEAGLQRVGIFVSGGLDEFIIRDLLQRGAPINGFGVGSAMGVSSDAPVLDSAYKLAGYGGEGRMKLSPGKTNLPGRKQVFRITGGSDDAHDVIARHDEPMNGRPLLVKMMEGGRRTEAGRESLENARRRARHEIASLPERLHSLEPAEEPYRVEISPGLKADRDRLAQSLRRPAART